MSDAPAEPVEILLIEDNPGDVRLIEEMFNEATDRAATVPEPESVGTPNLRHADRLSDGLRRLDGDSRVDVVLLDLGLPDSTGIETLETVRDRSQETPIVVLTGLHDETVGVRAVQQGAQEYLVKDELTPPLLYRAIRHAIERKKFERTQTALHRASRDLVQTESKTEASRVAVDAAVDVLDHPGVVIYLFDESASVLRPTAYTEYVEDAFGEVPSFGPRETSVTWESFVDDETVVIEDLGESERASPQNTLFRSGLWIPLGGHGVLLILSEGVGSIDQQTQQLADHLAATTEAALDRVEREESLREQERELATRNQQLEELNRINELIREIDQVLVQATTRDAIEQAVCELLTQTERFAFAWIGEVAEETLRPRAWAGDDRGYLDAVSLSIDADDGPPAVTAVSTEAAVVVPNVASDLRGAPWRKAALARELQSVISIPLRYNEMPYGVLTVFSAEPGALDEQSKNVFEELGETIAYAINSAETRQTLLTDTVVELELAVYGSDGPIRRLSSEAKCQIEYGGIVPQSDGTTRIFFSASGAPSSAIVAAAEDVPSIRRLDLIGEADGPETYRFEATVSGQTIPSTLVECGAITRSIRVTESAAQVVVELPDTTDVRSFVARLEERYPGTELRARRDKERADRTERTFGTALETELTSRQLETLQTAYHSGYFEWPRDRTGEEVASTLGITQPTFNGHLRAAERKLCALLFDDDPSSSDEGDQHT
ncbi:bacterio-opsin activator domain-containing protein [Haloprofundus salilacus]|uniref:bacterio-opsin activator domain-containing protein n=1 Tax=Haloprofundus salilacus TaxID=2876190 RepID=UPI001CCF4D41|nr:bacterio-opsin activator domain-containing protein [Haloprofundus salilacus]